MNTACKECGRTHTRNGNPARIVKSGKHAGLCGTCAHRARYQPRTRAKSPQLLPDGTDGGLNHYLTNRRAHLNTPPNTPTRPTGRLKPQNPLTTHPTKN